MHQVIGEVLPFAVVVMVSPLNVIAAVLLLFAPRRLAAASAYLGGFFLGVAAAVVALNLVASQFDWSANSETSRAGAALRIALGLTLAVAGFLKLRAAASPHAPSLPGWMDGIATMAPRRAASTGLLIGALNPKNLAMAGATAMAVGTAGLSTVEVGVVVAIYAAIASAGVAAPAIADLVGGDRSVAPLIATRSWLEGNHEIVLGVMYLVFAPVLVGRGIAAF